MAKNFRADKNKEIVNRQLDKTNLYVIQFRLEFHVYPLNSMSTIRLFDGLNVAHYISVLTKFLKVAQ